MKLSVRFFKRLFLALLAAAILVPSTLAVCFGVSAQQARKQVSRLEEQLEAAEPVVSEEKSADVPAAEGTQSELSYQSLYPELYCRSYDPGGWKREENVAYLTFDDGPSSNTEEILEILRKNDIRATFFVTHRGDRPQEELLRKILSEGHTLAIHTYSHEYGTIYGSVEAYLEDFQQVYQWIEEATGVQAELFRFPGGSINGYNAAIYQPLIAEMTRRGFTYFDWNVSGEDAANGATAQSVTDAVLGGVDGCYRAIILLHDAADKDYTVQALPQIISGIQERGFSFAPLTAQIKPVAFSYRD
ncbi:MAG: polysaccharide deacetylase family protein [Oscillospiraceae bacterium]